MGKSNEKSAAAALPGAPGMASVFTLYRFAGSCDKLVALMKNGAQQIRKTNISLWAGSPAARQTESSQDRAGLQGAVTLLPCAWFMRARMR
jgi:hypothetical protein